MKNLLKSRLIVICGYYGSGKTNIAVNCALRLRAEGKRVTIADLDIVNPYFRTKDSEEILKKHGIGLVCSAAALAVFGADNLVIPAMVLVLIVLLLGRKKL